MRRAMVGTVLAAVVSLAGFEAQGAPTIEQEVNGVRVVPFGFILERLKCDVWKAADAAKADGHPFKTAKGSFMLKAEVSNTITGGVGVEVEATGLGASVGGSISKSKGRVRQIELPFSIAVAAGKPEFDCDRLKVKTKDGSLADEALFEYVSLSGLADKVGKGGAVITLKPATYGGEFTMIRTGAGEGELTILVFTAKGGLEQARGLTQEFELELEFDGPAPSRIFPTK